MKFPIFWGDTNVSGEIVAVGVIDVVAEVVKEGKTAPS